MPSKRSVSARRRQSRRGLSKAEKLKRARSRMSKSSSKRHKACKGKRCPPTKSPKPYCAMSYLVPQPGYDGHNYIGVKGRDGKCTWRRTDKN